MFETEHAAISHSSLQQYSDDQQHTEEELNLQWRGFT
jgi:hypothetical protein